MNYLTVTGLLIFVTSTFCSFTVFFSKPLSVLKSTWGLFSLAVGIWGFGLYKAYSANEYDSALMWLRILNLSAITIPVFFVNFVILFSNKFAKKIKEVRIYYGVAGLIICLSVIKPSFFIPSLSPKVGFNFYPNPGILYYLFFLFFSYLVAYGIFLLIKAIRGASSLQAIQGKYILVGTAIGFLGGSTTFFPVFGIPLFPFGTCLVIIYVLSITYAIVRYRLMDIRLVISNTAIFIVVYTLVLGAPFYLYAVGFKLIALFVMLALASAGPIIFDLLRRRAENQILKEEKRIQDVLKKTSIGLTTIRDLRQLLNLILNVLIKNIGLNHAAVYLLDPDTDSYSLRISYPTKDHPIVIQADNILISYLKEKKYPIIYEEIKHFSEGKNKKNIEASQAALSMQELSASVAIPLIGEKKLLGFIILGDRQENAIYSAELISVLFILGNQVALALEIIMSIVERDKLLNENFQKSRFESLALLCTSISHQIDNRFQGIFYSLQDPLGVFKKSNYKDYSKEDLIALLENFAISAKESVQIAKDGATVTRGILDVSKGAVEFGLVNFDSAVNTSVNFVQLKRGNQKIDIRKDYPKDVILWASQAFLYEILSNAIDNSWFAMNLKKNHFNDPNYSPLIIIRGHMNTSMFYFELEDNGMGIKKDDIHKVLDPMFSTKGTLQGTGMGTTVMLQFIQQHGGSIAYESEYEKWTKVKITLPLATEEQKGTVKNV